MTWNPANPADSSKISQAPSVIRQNWSAIDSGVTGVGTGFTRNHVTMTDATNGGLHSRVDFYTAVASPAIAGFVASCYPKTVTNVELAYKNGTEDITITNSLLSAASGQGMLPGGLQIRAGIGTAPGTINFNLAFPTACLSVVVSTVTASVVFDVTAKTASSFTVANAFGIGSGSIYYIAIGY